MKMTFFLTPMVVSENEYVWSIFANFLREFVWYEETFSHNTSLKKYRKSKNTAKKLFEESKNFFS